LVWLRSRSYLSLKMRWGILADIGLIQSYIL
jgi:hypothetical protein